MDKIDYLKLAPKWIPEEQIIRILKKSPMLLPTVEAMVSEDDFSDELRNIYHALVMLIKENKSIEPFSMFLYVSSQETLLYTHIIAIQNNEYRMLGELQSACLSLRNRNKLKDGEGNG